MQHISQLKSNNLTPNLTLVLPGPCQAHCSFCNWKQNGKIGQFILNLDKLLKQLPKNFRQISISGGEPTLSPVFSDVIEMLRKTKEQNKIDKVVLTTNGVNLNYDYTKLITGVVDHVNISRHHHDDKANRKVFFTDKVPDEVDLKMIISNCNNQGIDVNFNCVFNSFNDYINVFELQQFVGFAKSMGASSISFRNQYDDFVPSKLQQELEDTRVPKTEQSCPVCFTKTFLVQGMPIKFHHSSYEPTDNTSFDKDETYELILHGNGVLSRDWEGKKEISLDDMDTKVVDNIDSWFNDISGDKSKTSKLNPSNKSDVYVSCSGAKIVQTYSSCGGEYLSCG